MCDINQLTEQAIANRLTQQKDPEYDLSDSGQHALYREAGVLMPFLRIDHAWHILYIRRAEFEGDRHSGQVAFPGGKYEEQDNDMLTTALREAHEEVGIEPKDVTVLGKLGYHYSASSFRITPIIGAIPWPYPLKLQTSEVGRTFTIPLQWLADPTNHEMREWKAPDQQQTHNIAYFKEYDGELLWGATARMTLNLLELLQG